MFSTTHVLNGATPGGEFAKFQESDQNYFNSREEKQKIEK